MDFGKFPEVASECVCPVIVNDNKEQQIEIEIYLHDDLIRKEAINKQLFQNNSSYTFSININSDKAALLSKIFKSSTELKNLCDIKRGIELGQKSELVLCDNCKTWNEAGEKYYKEIIKKKCKSCNSELSFQTLMCISNEKKNSTYQKECVAGKDLNRYSIWHKYFIASNLKGIDYKEKIFEGDRIFLKRIAQYPQGSFLSRNEILLAFNTIYSLYNISISPHYLLGAINSSLSKFYYENTYNLGMSLTTQVTTEYLRQLPIRIPQNENEIRLINEIIKLVKILLVSNQQLQQTTLPQQQEQLQQRIAFTDKKIDTLVYELYGLSEEEVRIVEGTK